MISKRKILFTILAIAIFAGLCSFLIVYRERNQNESPQQQIAPENITAILGPGFPMAVEKVAEMCGEDIRLLSYRTGGYYTGKVYEEDTQLSKDKIVEYNFTQGNCGPGHYAEITVVFDVEQNSVTDGPIEHPLARDTREPIDETDLQRITISINKATKISGRQPNGLFKLDSTVIWDMSSNNGGLVHRVWINATTGEKMRDETFSPSL